MATSLLVLEQNIAKAGFGYVAITPSAAGTTTTVTANGAGSELDPDDTSSLYYNAWLKCVSDSAGTPLNVGEIRRLDKDTGYVASTGVLTVTRAFTNNTSTTQRFGIFMGISPEDYGLSRGLKTHINDVLRKLYYRRPFLLTLVTDGDMETSGVTNWTASNLDTDLSIKSTTTGITLGKQSLRVKTSAANGYFRTASINVVPNQVYLVAADVTVPTGTATLELYDVTNSASIKTASSSEKTARRVWFIANVPSTCRQVQVRLIGVASADDAYWDNVTLLNRNATEMALPSWLVNKKWYEGLRMWQAGPTSTGGVDQALDDIRRWPLLWSQILDDPNGYTPFKLMFKRTPIAGTLLIGTALSTFAELSADTDTTDCNADLVKAWTLYFVALDKGDEQRAKRWWDEAQYWDKLYQPRWEGQRFQFRDPH